MTESTIGPRTLTCPECEGRGYIAYHVAAPAHALSVEPPDTGRCDEGPCGRRHHVEECRACRGEGLLWCSSVVEGRTGTRVPCARLAAVMIEGEPTCARCAAEIEKESAA